MGALVLIVAIIGVAIGTGVRLVLLQRSNTAGSGASVLPEPADIQAALSHRPGFRVLFVGNSLTYVNDLPHLVAGLARGTHGIPRPLLAAAWAPPGSSLADDLQNRSFRRLLAARRWNVIVLQEGTALSSVFDRNPRQMDTDVAILSTQARRLGAIPILFETWGNRTGTDSEPYGYEQAAVAANYASVGTRHGVDVAPAGAAWARALDQDPTQNLWVPDGHHPSLTGSYLAASVITSCISYAVSHHEAAANPIHNGYTAGLEPSVAQWLRRVAWTTIRTTHCDPTSLSQ